MKTSPLISTLAVSCLFAGCASLPVYEEPEEIPRAIATYQDEKLGEATKKIAVNLDFHDCVEAALIVSKGAFGGSDIEAEMPVKPIVKREFERMTDDNFHETAMDEESDLTIKVSTMRILMTRKFRKIEADISINVKVLHPDGSRAPIFKKTYRSKTFCPVSDDDVVPTCFYQAVQQIAADVVTDLSSDRNVYQYLRAKGQKENGK